MSKQTEHKVDRTGWPAGPWDEEGDKEVWKTDAGLPGMIARNRMGAWCGYVAVTGEHPLYGKSYDDVHEEIPGLEVHGGLTYSGKCQGHICHVPEPGESDDVFWFGFDCNHAGDEAPAMLMWSRKWESEGGPKKLPPLPGEGYRDAAYAKLWVEKLAQQLAHAGAR